MGTRELRNYSGLDAWNEVRPPGSRGTVAAGQWGWLRVTDAAKRAAGRVWSTWNKLHPRPWGWSIVSVDRRLAAVSPIFGQRLSTSHAPRLGFITEH